MGISRGLTGIACRRTLAKLAPPPAHEPIPNSELGALYSSSSCYSSSPLLQVDIDKLDYSLYLPLFFDGLAETKHPYKTYARQGVTDLLLAGGERIHPVIPQLILPLKSEYQEFGWHANASNFLGLICTLRIQLRVP